MPAKTCKTLPGSLWWPFHGPFLFYFIGSLIFFFFFFFLGFYDVVSCRCGCCRLPGLEQIALRDPIVPKLPSFPFCLITGAKCAGGERICGYKKQEKMKKFLETKNDERKSSSCHRQEEDRWGCGCLALTFTGKRDIQQWRRVCLIPEKCDAINNFAWITWWIAGTFERHSMRRKRWRKGRDWERFFFQACLDLTFSLSPDPYKEMRMQRETKPLKDAVARFWATKRHKSCGE